MKSNVRTEAEIHAVANIWNNETGPYQQEPSIDQQICSAVYHTLCWARGMREKRPAELLRKRLAKTSESVSTRSQDVAGHNGTDPNP